MKMPSKLDHFGDLELLYGSPKENILIKGIPVASPLTERATLVDLKRILSCSRWQLGVPRKTIFSHFEVGLKQPINRNVSKYEDERIGAHNNLHFSREAASKSPYRKCLKSYVVFLTKNTIFIAVMRPILAPVHRP